MGYRTVVINAKPDGYKEEEGRRDRCFYNLVCAIPLACAKMEFARAPSLNKKTNKQTGGAAGVLIVIDRGKF